MNLKETFIKNLSEISNGKKQKELAEIMGCSEGTISKYLNPLKKDFPTAEMLYNLAECCDVSLDWLLGRNKNPKIKSRLSAKDICQFLISIYESPSSFRFGKYHITENCYYLHEDMRGDIDYNRVDETHIYDTLYFSEWEPVENTYESQCIASQIGNQIPTNVAINKFIHRLINISKMFKEGNLDQEMYNRLLESYLNDVPDK